MPSTANDETLKRLFKQALQQRALEAPPFEAMLPQPSRAVTPKPKLSVSLKLAVALLLGVSIAGSVWILWPNGGENPAEQPVLSLSWHSPTNSLLYAATPVLADSSWQKPVVAAPQPIAPVIEQWASPTASLANFPGNSLLQQSFTFSP